MNRLFSRAGRAVASGARVLTVVRSPPALIMLSMVAWVATEVVGTIGFNGLASGPTPIPQIVWLRYFFHLLFMLVVFGVPTRLAFVRTRRPGLHVARSLLMLAMPMSYALAVQMARPFAVLGVFAVFPVLVLAMARLAGDRGQTWTALAVAVGWIGTLVVYRPPIAEMGWGALAAVAMAASFSGYLVLTRVLDRTEPLLTNLFYSAVGVFAALSIALPFLWTPIGARELVSGAAVAVTGWLTLYLLELALRRDTPSRLAPFLFAQALIDVGFRAIDRGRDLSADLVLGALLIAAALTVALIARRRARRPDAAVAPSTLSG
jgi:drug/metabolite transporter (DMT)-like permease